MSWIFHRHSSDEPCPFMVEMLHKKSSGRAGWLTNLYVVAHVARCTPCRKFLAGLEALLVQLREAKKEEIPAEALDRLMAELGSLHPQDQDK